MVHVRDSLQAATEVTAAELMRPALTLGVSVPVYEALGMMREVAATSAPSPMTAR